MRYSTFTLWAAAANAALLQTWGINYADAGAEESDLQQWYADHQATGETVLECARAYGESYDLNEVDPMTAQDLKRMYPIPAPDIVATPEQIAAATAPVLFKGDPNTTFDGTALPFAENEGLAAGNGGSILFDLTTGKVTRHFPGVDFGPDHAGYLDIATIDIKDLLKRRKVKAFKTGALFDINECGYTTADGEYEEACED